MDITQGGPCEKTILQRGDELVEINGVSVAGKSPQEIVMYTMGEEGSEAVLGIKRGASLCIAFKLQFRFEDTE